MRPSFACRADELGFDGVCVTEHHYAPSGLPSPNLMAALTGPEARARFEESWELIVDCWQKPEPIWCCIPVGWRLSPEVEKVRASQRTERSYAYKKATESFTPELRGKWPIQR